MMTDDSTSPSYWLNWRFLLCAIWVFVAMMFAALLIWRYEGRPRSRDQTSGDQQQEAAGCLYDDEVWGTCSKSIHPIWLLSYRIVAFCALLALLLADFFINGVGKLYFYTGWTFTLVTLYFGVCYSFSGVASVSVSLIGSSLSLHSYLHYRHEVEPERDNCVSYNADRGSYVPPILGESADMPNEAGSSNRYAEPNCRIAASGWGYALQIVFQMSAGAVALTDSVFWLILYPSVPAKYRSLSFLIICKHSVNAVFLLGDTILNRLRFPFFRIAYFVLWTCMFVIFQWIIHACVSIRYFAVGLMVFPCYGIFALAFRIKHFILVKVANVTVSASHQ